MGFRHLFMFVSVSLCLWIYSVLYFELRNSHWTLISTHSWVFVYWLLSVFLLPSVGPDTHCFSVSMNVEPAYSWWFRVNHLFVLEVWISNTDTQGLISYFLFFVEDRAVGLSNTQSVALSFPAEFGTISIWQTWKWNLGKCAWFVYIHIARNRAVFLNHIQRPYD